MEKKSKLNTQSVSDNQILEHRWGKDELNFAEFPLALASNNSNRDIKTIIFKSKVFDKQKNKEIEMKLTIAASEEFGLPTPKDTEVIKGLIQLSAIDGFKNRTITFSRYQLINLFGLTHNGQNYERLKESLKRWKGVTLYYDNAWRDPKTKSWVSEYFSIIDNVRIREPKDDNSPDMCSISWNEVVFNSLQNGNVKNLDFLLYKSLKTPISQRMFEYLDKCFGRRRGLHKFDLQEFAYERIGLSRNYDIGKIKERLSKAINELEKVGFILPRAKSARYQKKTIGKWLIFFEKGDLRNFAKITEPQQQQLDFRLETEPAKSKPKRYKSKPRASTKKAVSQPKSKIKLNQQQEAIYEKLTARNITEQKAEELSQKHSFEYLDEKVEMLDLLKKKGFPIKSQAGYLIKMIENDWVADEVKTSYQKKREAKARRIKKEAENKRYFEKRRAEQEADKIRKEKVAKENAIKKAEWERTKNYLNSKNETEREQIISRALADMESFKRDMVEFKIKSGGKREESSFFRDGVKEYVFKLLGEKSQLEELKKD